MVSGGPDGGLPLCALGDDGALSNLTGHLDRNVLPLTPAISPAGPQWSDDGGAVITIEDQGKIKLARMEVDGTTTELVAGRRAVTGASPTPDSDGCEPRVRSTGIRRRGSTVRGFLTRVIMNVAR